MCYLLLTPASLRVPIYIQDVMVHGGDQGLQAKVLMLPPQAMWAGMNE